MNAWEFFKSFSKSYDITNSQLRWEGLRKKIQTLFSFSILPCHGTLGIAMKHSLILALSANIFIVSHSLHLNARNDGWFEDVISQKKTIDTSLLWKQPTFNVDNWCDWKISSLRFTLKTILSCVFVCVCVYIWVFPTNIIHLVFCHLLEIIIIIINNIEANIVK